MATCSARSVGLVIVGHVDNGKSTLIGRMFHDAGLLPEGKYEQLETAARRRGIAFEFANLMDALQAERDQNVTIDTAQIWLNWKGRRYVIIDAPGHKEFLKNMVTGAARADAGLVVLDAERGVMEQSRRHGFLLTLLGIQQIVVVINKMDLVGYAQSRFNEVAREYAGFLSSLGVEPLAIVPAAARNGDHVVQRSQRMPWACGLTVIDTLSMFTPAASAGDQPLRFPVQDVYRFDRRRILAGRIEAGGLRVGDHLRFLPSGKQGLVTSIERWPSGGPVSATAGESVGITLEEELFIDRGDVACALDDSACSQTEFHARVFWLGTRALVLGRQYVLRLTTQELPCEVVAIDTVIDASTLAAQPYREMVTANDVADLVIRTSRPVVFDRYCRVPKLGRFVIVDGREVAGGGTVTRAVGPHVAGAELVTANLSWSPSGVTAAERHRRNRHRGAVVWFTGLPGSGKSTIATALERELFDRGLQVFVLDGDNIRHGLSANLGFSEADRSENIRRVAEAAKLFGTAGFVAVVAFISPYRIDRARAREIIGPDLAFVEVYLDVSLEICERRDPKGLYAKARQGAIVDFTGISAPYEPPESAEVTLRTAEQTVEEAVALLGDYLRPLIETTPDSRVEYQRAPSQHHGPDDNRHLRMTWKSSQTTLRTRREA